MTKIDSSEVSRFPGQITGKIEVAKIVVRRTMFDSPYLGTLKSELQNFAAVHRTFCVHQMCEK